MIPPLSVPFQSRRQSLKNFKCPYFIKQIFPGPDETPIHNPFISNTDIEFVLDRTENQTELDGRFRRLPPSLYLAFVRNFRNALNLLDNFGKKWQPCWLYGDVIGFLLKASSAGFASFLPELEYFDGNLSLYKCELGLRQLFFTRNSITFTLYTST